MFICSLASSPGGRDSEYCLFFSWLAGNCTAVICRWRQWAFKQRLWKLKAQLFTSRELWEISEVWLLTCHPHSFQAHPHSIITRLPLCFTTQLSITKSQVHKHTVLTLGCSYVMYLLISFQTYTECVCVWERKKKTFVNIFE